MCKCYGLSFVLQFEQEAHLLTFLSVDRSLVCDTREDDDDGNMMRMLLSVMQALKDRAAQIIKLNRVVVFLKGTIIFILIPLSDNENRDISNRYYGKHCPDWLPSSKCSGT